MTEQTKERRKDFDRALTLRLLHVEEVNNLIKALRAAKKTCLHRGGHVTVTIRDSKLEDVRCYLLVDLTQDAMRKHI